MEKYVTCKTLIINEKHGGKEYIEYTGLSITKCTEPMRSET